MGRILIPSQSRKLASGYGWQKYVAMTIRMVNGTDFAANWKSFSEMEAARAVWIDKISAFIYNRSRKLGLIVDQVTQQLIEEPNESKMLEVKMWEGGDISCLVPLVWSWPGPESMIRRTRFPWLVLAERSKLSGQRA
jgi:hypothetical protein